MTTKFPAAAVALAAWLACTGLAQSQSDIVRNAPWRLPPPGVQPSLTVSYLATGGGGIACYGSPRQYFVGGRDTWWCFSPSNDLVGYLHADAQEFRLYRQNMALRCRYFYVAAMEQPQTLPRGVFGWNGRGECVGEGPYNVAVRWAG